ncbi:SDR family oxidoreductase [Brachybacterium sp. DNPG3]
MSKFAILGATGTAGQHVVAAVEAAGHEAVPLSRATGVDLHTGEGLVEGLTGADVVIDASNAYPTDPAADVVETFRSATELVIVAAEEAGVAHLVHLSICGIGAPAFDAFPYYLAKRAQEQALKDSSLPHTIVRSAQWMEFAMNPAAVTEHEDRIEVQDWLIQPVAVQSVAEVLVECAVRAVADPAAASDPLAARDRQVAGPEPIRLPDLTALHLEAVGDARPIERTHPPVPELESGVLLAPTGAELLGPTPGAWAAAQSRWTVVTPTA